MAAAALVTLWSQLATPVMSEECYYWLYGESLDWSYFDHPGMIGWTIHLGTKLLGDNALGLRLVAGLSWLLTTWVGLRWLRDLGGDRSSERLWLALSLGVPLFGAGHLLATPDAPLTAFYCLSAREFWKLARSPSRWRFALAGAYTGLALLSKYTAAFLLVGLVLQLCLDPAFRARTRSTDLALFLGSLALTCAPVVVWNSQHDWASFRFQTEGRCTAVRFSLESPANFAATQLLLVSPLMLWIGARAIAWALRRARAGDGRLVALIAHGLPLPLFLLACSFGIPVKRHWATPAYVPLAILGALWWQAAGRNSASAGVRRLGGAWMALSWIACAGLPAIRYLPQIGGTHWDPGQEIGNRALTAVQSLDEPDRRTFLFATNHLDSAELLWWQQSPEAALSGVPVLAQNVRGRPAKQFDYRPDPRQFIGWNAVFALDGTDERPGKISAVREHFDSVELVDTVESTLCGQVLRRVRLFACRNYYGPGSRPSPLADGATRTASVAPRHGLMGAMP